MSGGNRESLDKETVREVVENGHSMFEEISDILQQGFLNKWGLNVKSLKRFCHTHVIQRRTKLADDELDKVVKPGVDQVL